MRALPLLCLLAIAPACAQTDKPSTSGETGERRADTLVVTPGAKPELEAEIMTVIEPGTVLTDRTTVEVGSLPVDIVMHKTFGPDMRADTFWAINLHDDESTSVDAALAVAQETGGIVVELVHTGERNLRFQWSGTIHGADPNRMFTEAGLTRTLASLSDGKTSASGAVNELATKVLLDSGLSDAAVIVTLHNNTEDRYSALSYASGGDYEVDAEAVTIHEGMDPDDFFFVTDRPLYDALVARGFNAVLQDNARATDDGSLSVWAAQNDRPYVNVEAQHGHLAEQTRMIRALVEVMSAR